MKRINYNSPTFSIVFTVLALLCLLSLHLQLTSALRLHDIKKFTADNIEKRSPLLDILVGRRTEGNAATSIKGSGEEKSPLTDLAQSLIGKETSNRNLYIKILKLFFNLFMDIVMDRMETDFRREDTSSIQPLVKLLTPQTTQFTLPQSPAYERQAHTMIKRKNVYSNAHTF